MRGVENFNRVCVLEALVESVGIEDRGSVRLDLKNLSEYRKEDQMFSNYLLTSENRIRHTFRVPPLYIGASENFTYACYDEETETLTENGWKKFNQVQEGEKIATLNPETNLLEYHVPENLYVYPVPQEMVKIKADKVDVRVTPNHDLWVHYHMIDGCRWEKVQAKDTMFFENGRHAFTVQTRVKGVAGGVIPTNLPIPDAKLFMEFLGLLVGRGWMGTDGPYISFSYLKNTKKRKQYWRLCQTVASQLPDAILEMRMDKVWREHKLIVTSATYQQSSRVTPALLARIEKPDRPIEKAVVEIELVVRESTARPASSSRSLEATQRRSLSQRLAE